MDIGIGVKVEIGRGAIPSWTELEKVGDVEFPTIEYEEIDVTHQQSANRQKEFIRGLADWGDFSVPMKFVPGSVTDDLLLELLDSGETVKIRITVPATTPFVETYSGYLKSYGRTLPVGDAMEAEATFRINAKVANV